MLIVETGLLREDQGYVQAFIRGVQGNFFEDFFKGKACGAVKFLRNYRI
jgi:hypothetical protein